MSTEQSESTDALFGDDLLAEAEENASARSRIVAFGDKDLEVRELAYGDRQKALRRLMKKTESRQGKRQLKREEIDEQAYLTAGFAIRVAYIPGTDRRAFQMRHLPRLLGLPTSVTDPLFEAAAQLNGLRGEDNEVEIDGEMVDVFGEFDSEEDEKEF